MGTHQGLMTEKGINNTIEESSTARPSVGASYFLCFAWPPLICFSTRHAVTLDAATQQSCKRNNRDGCDVGSFEQEWRTWLAGGVQRCHAIVVLQIPAAKCWPLTADSTICSHQFCVGMHVSEAARQIGAVGNQYFHQCLADSVAMLPCCPWEEDKATNRWNSFAGGKRWMSWPSTFVYKCVCVCARACTVFFAI